MVPDRTVGGEDACEAEEVSNKVRNNFAFDPGVEFVLPM